MPSKPSAPSLSHSSFGQGSRIPDDLVGSDYITDDNNIISSRLSGDNYHFYILDFKIITYLYCLYEAYPPPPEPAPRDLPPSRMKKGSLTAGHHTSRTSLEEGTQSTLLHSYTFF
ncbi:rho GTPase-activating protein 190 [Nephila pilipes]|uniref:Rho GTPase-activating protein 190 n=1 Tax=Nephila pilipes TaxID=299642 RepID=A0A8X6M9B2_NEPPI|nr:rho GTPase-activating protein 190 [Nephila pilipes]